MGNKSSKQKHSKKNKKVSTKHQPTQTNSSPNNNNTQNEIASDLFASPTAKRMKAVQQPVNTKTETTNQQQIKKNQMLEELKKMKKPSKQITTKVRTRDGKVFTETINTDGTISRKLDGQMALAQPLSPVDAQTMQLESYNYNQESKTWVNNPISVSTDLSEQKMDVIKELTIISYNIWFAKYKFEERQIKLLSILKEINPDIFCFQEVTPRFLNGFCNDKYIQKHFELSDSKNNIQLTTVNPYGVMIGVNKNKQKLSMMELKICALNSNMGRKLVSCKVKLGSDKSIWINTVHLESLNNSDYRIDQLQTIFDVYMKDQSETILMGDFNFGDYTKENEYISNEFSDCWKEYKQMLIDNNETDNKKKILAGNTGFGTRFDRMLLCSDKWNVKQFEIIGKPNMPSDHLGIVTKLTATEH